jgi:hypothetical protein
VPRDITRGAALGLPCGHRHEEATEMLNGDIARYRTDDLLRTGDARRVRRTTERRHAAARRAHLRAIATSVVTLVTVPFHR